MDVTFSEEDDDKYAAGEMIHEDAEAHTSNRKGKHNHTQEIRVNEV